MTNFELGIRQNHLWDGLPFDCTPHLSALNSCFLLLPFLFPPARFTAPSKPSASSGSRQYKRHRRSSLSVLPLTLCLSVDPCIPVPVCIAAATANTRAARNWGPLTRACAQNKFQSGLLLICIIMDESSYSKNGGACTKKMIRKCDLAPRGVDNTGE